MNGLRQRIVVAVMAAFDQYQQALLTGMRAVFDGHDIAVLAHADDSDGAEIPRSLIRIMDLPSACGVIATSTNSGERDRLVREACARRGLPLVHIGQDVPGHACVRADNRQAMVELMRLVLDDCGARTPVLARGHAHQQDHLLREEVFRAEIARRGLAIDEELIIAGGISHTLTRQAMRSLLASRRDFDAVICMNDAGAVGAIDALAEAGLNVPKDVIVTGFDNYPTGAISWPSVTTVDQQLEGQGATAATAVLDALAGTARRDRMLATCRLLPRDSTAIGLAVDAGVPQTAEHIARVARAHVMGRAEQLWTAVALKRCQTIEEVCQALPQGFAGLEISRAFLVIYEGTLEGATVQEEAGPDAARVVLDYRDEAVHPVPDATFPADRILPDHCSAELHRGFLGIKELAGSTRPLGYLVFEQRPGGVPIVERLVAGISRAVDVIFSTSELVARSATLEHVVVRRTQELAREVDARHGIEQELRAANTELERSVLRDDLTGVSNRVALRQYLAEHWSNHVASQASIAVVIIDIDCFKAYNDRYGHLRGDEALRTVASCLLRTVRHGNDLVCRFGGEEFLVVLPFSDLRAALTVARRFSRLLRQAAIQHAGSPIIPVVTVSIGVVAVIPDAGTTPEALISAADEALYRAKNTGRNQIVTGRLGPVR
ncbi:MAG: diguanylate cyclase [Micromonosporaceae bacterium]|nr:diguanylate cyclase [Micromonosporaceae bacterium]